MHRRWRSRGDPGSRAPGLAVFAPALLSSPLVLARPRVVFYPDLRNDLRLILLKSWTSRMDEGSTLGE